MLMFERNALFDSYLLLVAAQHKNVSSKPNRSEPGNFRTLNIKSELMKSGRTDERLHNNWDQTIDEVSPGPV